MITNVLVSFFAPFGTLSLAAPPSSTRLSDLLPLLNAKYPLLPSSGLILSTHSSGTQPSPYLQPPMNTNPTRFTKLRPESAFTADSFR
ncbi:hypothetical protein F5878DRAFT_323998 [Lentinula raphanica]|uniref:Sde2 ubiquitin domain-containing protein n=1 Tax=Lentinula raphanica TaxID=153919 RepID=A0AA38P2V4_9AGAR|nr:hypothetical protein F5878DRAFT_323998 [Lentinula raphanica]